MSTYSTIAAYYLIMMSLRLMVPLSVCGARQLLRQMRWLASCRPLHALRLPLPPPPAAGRLVAPARGACNPSVSFADSPVCGIRWMSSATARLRPPPTAAHTAPALASATGGGQARGPFRGAVIPVLVPEKCMKFCGKVLFTKPMVWYDIKN